MDMKKWIEMWKVISEEKEIEIPAQLHLRGQFKYIINVFGSAKGVYEYFKEVEKAENPIIN